LASATTAGATFFSGTGDVDTTGAAGGTGIAGAAATIVALPDALLRQRLAGSAGDRESVIAELQAQGSNPLIAGAFVPRAIPDAA